MSLSSISNTDYQKFRDGIITEEELDFKEMCASIEKQWIRQLPKFTPYNLIEMFPDMKSKIKRSLKLTVYDESIPFTIREKAAKDLKTINDPTSINDDMIAIARMADVPSMMNKRDRAQTGCLWCSSSDALTIYPNAVKCYSCNKWADAISVYQVLNKVNFINAVKALQ